MNREAGSDVPAAATPASGEGAGAGGRLGSLDAFRGFTMFWLMGGKTVVLGRSHRDGWGTVLSAIPAIATTVVGLLFGQVLMAGTAAGTKLKVFVLTGVGCLAAGYGLSPFVPIIMKLWTTSYALVATGWACVFFSMFYWVIDLRGWRGWTFPLVVIGANALAAYLLNTIIPISRIVGTFTKPLVPALGGLGPVLATGAVFFAGWLILCWLYHRKIFLRP